MYLVKRYRESSETVETGLFLTLSNLNMTDLFQTARKHSAQHFRYELVELLTVCGIDICHC